LRDARNQPSTTTAWLERFADAIKFLPAGMRSHWFSDGRAGRATQLNRGFNASQYTVAATFQPPADLGAGPWEESRSRTTATAACRPSASPISAKPGLASLVLPCGSGRAAAKDLPCDAWIAIVAERFVVSASSEALLREALAQRGALRFGSLEPLARVSRRRRSASSCATSRARHGTAKAPLSMKRASVSAIAASTRTRSTRAHGGRDAKGLIALTHVLLLRLPCFRASPSIDAAGWHTFVVTKEASETDVEDWYWDNWLRSLMWFGAWIFI
jgi:hypothetical protein